MADSQRQGREHRAVLLARCLHGACSSTSVYLAVCAPAVCAPHLHVSRAARRVDDRDLPAGELVLGDHHA